MDCNKDKAARAKAWAERKLLDRDFIGAKKLIIKAQKLSKEVDDIDMQRMLTICDVHCGAAAGEVGQIEWYGILQVPETADDAQIKQQYLKLSLLLHPDKNKFGGAEAAFKLVGEAYETLTDRSQRSLYDMERVLRATTQTSFWTICPFCETRYEYHISSLEKVVHCWNQDCLKNFIAHEEEMDESSDCSISETSGDSEEEIAEKHGISEKSLELDPEALSLAMEEDITSIALVSVQGILEKSLELDPAMLSLDMGDIPSTSSAQVVSIMHGSAVHDLMEQANVTAQKTSDCEEEVAEPGAAPNGSGLCQRTHRSSWQKQEVKNEENDDVFNDNVDDFVNSHGIKRLRKSFMFHGDHHCNKGTDLNKEIAGHNCLTNGVNICSDAQTKEVYAHAPCGEKSFNKIQQMKGETLHGGKNGDGKEKEFRSGRSNGLGRDNDDASDKYKFTKVDPHFFEFRQLRDEDEFRTKQIWAVCDDQDCMPRSYAQITKVKTMPYFMLHFVWLEFEPSNKVELAWSFSGLPVACGHFRHGKSDTTKETSMFSRTISCEKSKTRNCYEIYPREGEVWALFKGWDIGWSSDPDNHKHWSHKYEVVQVLSDLTTSSAIIAMPLVKIKGFVSLFMQSREADRYVIPKVDTLRFSHCVPHHLISGNEKGVPKGSLELDPAALPLYMLQTFPFETSEYSSISENHGDKYAGSFSGNSSRKGSMSIGEGQRTPCMNAGIAAETLKEENNKHSTFSAEVTNINEHNICQAVYVRAEYEFYDFSQRTLLQKFSAGQIWALYSDVDKFPNYYGFIQKVDLKNGEVQVRWLDVCPHGEEEQRLLQEERTIGCGIFRLSSVPELITYTGTDAFSHCVDARSTGTKGEYEIIPHLGEIWAVYKNWRVGWTAQDFGRCEYELVEILGHTDSSTRVELLRKVDGYQILFMPCGGEGSVKTIQKNEYPKFSHQIPCFRLLHEIGAKFRGCMELNPLSLPEEFLNLR